MVYRSGVDLVSWVSKSIFLSQEIILCHRPEIQLSLVSIQPVGREVSDHSI